MEKKSVCVINEEAKKKWCPWSRVSNVDGRHKDGALISVGQPSYNRQFVQDFDSTQDLQKGGKHTRMNLIPSTCTCLGSACMAWRSRMDDDSGYCGLAGVPADAAQALSESILVAKAAYE